MEKSAAAEIQEEANALIINVNENSESQREANSPSGNEIPNGRVKSATAEIQEESNALIINVNVNSESQREANSPSGRVDREANEHPDRALANAITQMIERWEPPSARLCRNYRVPHAIRRGNEEAYTPGVISIGPFHHGNERLKPMEELKVKYFKLLVKNSALDVENSLSTIRSMERDIRRCYEEPSMLSSDDYVKMILMDASFIIVLFLKSQGGEWESLVSDDHLIASQRSIALLSNDMRLLENQLPFFVIEELYNLAFPSLSNCISFKELTFNYFAYLNFQEKLYDPKLEIIHFVDLLRTIFLPTSLPDRVSSLSAVKLFYSASQLHEAGVKIRKGSSKCLFDLKFTKGELEIPSFILSRDMVSFFRNLMALEQCCYLDNPCVSDYFRVLGFLIDTRKDVDLLVQKGILLNRLGDSNVAATWLNNFSAHHAYNSLNCNYYTLCKELNTFYESRRHKWKAILIRDYFGNPWRTTGTLAAIILLVLTLIQAVCSIISVT